MAADVNTGMEKQDMKRLLMKSKTEPVNCAFAQGTDPTMALFMLDKVKQPKAVEKELTKEFPDAKNTRWGTAFVDMDDDPKQVKLTVNKPISGAARKLVKTLKGTGFTKVVILLEDGSVAESAGEEEEEGQAAGAAPEATAAPAAPPAAPPAPPAPPAAAQPDAAALTRALGELIRRIPGAVAAAPALKDALSKLATDANLNLKTNNLTTAATSIAALRKALDAAPQGATAAAPAAPPAPAAAPAKPPEGAKVTYAKSRLAWLAARKKMESEIEKLRGEIVASFQEDGEGPELDKLYRDRVAPVLQGLDESLADKLDEAANAADPAQHQKLLGEAKAIIKRYTDFLAAEPLIADLDDNPFVPLSINATMSATLTALSKAVV
jgi:hypothetical protein